MANTYNLTLTDGTPDGVVNPIDEKQTVEGHGLTFTGRGVVDYGEHRNTNLLHLLENFASDTAPTDPLTGQVWYNTSINQIRVWDGAAWTAVAIDDFVQSGTYVVGSGSANEVVLDKNPAGDDPTDVTIDNVAEYADLNNHLNGPSAHNATAISFDDSGVTFVATELQEAIEDLQTQVDAHINDAVDAHDASAVSFSSYLTITSANTQGAIQEIEDEIDALNSDITAAQNLIDNHIADPTNAHQATAISYDNASSGLSAVNVQDAIDEVESNISSGSAVGIVDYVRTRMTASQLISGNNIPEKLLFNSILFGDDLSNFDTGNNRYVADRDMEIRARAYVYYTALGDNQFGGLQIRINGSIVRTGFVRKIASSANPASTSVEITIIQEINSGDQVEAWAYIQSFAGTSDRTASNVQSLTGFEIEVLRDLTP